MVIDWPMLGRLEMIVQAPISTTYNLQITKQRDPLTDSYEDHASATTETEQ